MISVQSHPLRSNGNKFRIFRILILLIVVFSLQSCGFIDDLFRDKPEETKETTKVEDKKVEIKEVKWEDVTDAEEVIRNYPEESVKPDDIYDILCLLPFTGPHRLKGRSLYVGLKMAAKESNPGINLRFTTFDVARLKSEPEMLRKILSTPHFDFILAPYATDDVNQAIEIARGSGANILSPWNTSPSVNRFGKYIQLNPGLKSHYNGMVEFTARKFGRERTMIISGRKDAQLVEMLQNKAPGLENFYTASNPKQDISQLTQLISSKNLEAVILPSWRSSDEAYFLTLLSTLNAARDGKTLHVFVLASWLDNQNINYDQYKGLNLHFTNSRYINHAHRPIRRFEDRFIDEYHYFADDDIFYGHDIYMLISELLTEYQRRVEKEIVNFECSDCFFRYDFSEEISDDGQPFILNNHVDIISLKDFQYQRVN